jgi:hypothetical protein
MRTVLVAVCLLQLEPICKLHAVTRAPSPEGWLLLSIRCQWLLFIVDFSEHLVIWLGLCASAAIRSTGIC